jgi:HD superfamily phosphohydrolase
MDGRQKWEKLKEEKVFKDPVHRYIYVQDELIWALINSHAFQRLRRIRQLGTTYLTFHGAEHSRFNHSLGVYELMRRVLKHFRRNHDLELPFERVALGMCAALLHDIGHAPFSHSVEQCFKQHHEHMSCRIIREDPEVSGILNQFRPGFADDVAKVISKEHSDSFIVSLISSQLDVDRMDYLLRDSYYTGVNYGVYDLERVIRVLRPHQTVDGTKVVVKQSGMHAVEDYLVSRYQMFWQIYFHPVTRSAEILLHKIILRARTLYDDPSYTFRFLIEPLPNLFADQLSVEEYLLLDESFMQAVFRQWMKESDPILAELCGNFLNRKLFKYVLLDDLEDASRITAYVAQEMIARGINPTYYLEKDFPKDMAYHVYKSGENDRKFQITLYDAQQGETEMSDQSVIVRSISNVSTGAVRIYVPEAFLHVVEEGRKKNS